MVEVLILQTEAAPIQAIKLCQSLNSAQGYYKFSAGNKPLPLGSPDVGGFFYSRSRMLQLSQHYWKDYAFVVIVVTVPLEGNFYTITEARKVIALTFRDMQGIIQSAGITYEEYVAVTLVQELLSFEFQKGNPHLSWDDVFHKDPRNCLFDRAIDKIEKLKYRKLCESCREKLRSCDQRVLQALDRILDRVARSSLTKAIQYCVTAPGVSFIYSGIVVATAVNALTSLVFADSPPKTPQMIVLGAIAISVFSFPVVVYAWSRIVCEREGLSRGLAG